MRTVAYVLSVAIVGGSATAWAHRVANGDYVTLDEVSRRFNLSSQELIAEVNHRDILLSSVRHWLNTPVISARGELWVSATDVEQTIQPVAQPHGVPADAIVLDPGHGGVDSGTRGAHSMEKELTLDLAKRLEPILVARGFRVYPTRTTDCTLSLDERVEYCRRLGADLFVSLHFNAGGDAKGIETYCLTPEGESSTARPRSNIRALAPTTANPHNAASVWLAHCVQRALMAATQAEDRGVRRAQFLVLRRAPCPAILIEGGFLSNASEEQQLLRADYRDRLAQAIAEGIVAYCGDNHGGSHGKRGA